MLMCKLAFDCVGPLPCKKSGPEFLLTIICATTHFPKALPLRKITAPTVVKAVIKLYSVLGILKVIQTDQGSHVMSLIFSQGLKQLSINPNYSSAYHPELQGALERFHQTLAMLHAYCCEFEKDWYNGLHLILFAVREVVQESLGFNPSELAFAHFV